MKKILLFVISINTFFLCQSLAQTKEKQPTLADSLIEKLNSHSTKDTTRFNLLILYSDALEYLDTGESVNKAKEALQLAKELNYRMGVVRAYRHLGAIYLPRSDYSTSLDYAQKAIKEANEIGDTNDAQIIENNISQIYAMMGDFEHAIPGFKKFYQVVLKSGNEMSIAMALNNIALCYLNVDSLDSATVYLKQVIFYGEKLKQVQLLAYGYANMGGVLDKKGKYEEAKQNFEKALRIAQENKITEIILQTATGLSEANFYLKNYDDAAKYALQGIDMSKKAGVVQQQYEGYKLLTDIYQKQNKFKEAFEAYQNYVIMSDSMKEVKKQVEIVRQVEKGRRAIEKEKADAIISETEIRNKFLWITLLVVLISTLLSFIFYKRQRDTKQKIEMQIALLLQRNEIRQRTYQDFHDEIGSGLTKITMNCTNAKTNSKNQLAVESLLDKIMNDSILLSTNLTDIIWATNPENDNLTSLFAKIRTYSADFFENIKIPFTLEITDDIDSFVTRPETNRNIFLILKEGLNNIAKHSNATHVDIKFLVDESKNFKLVIADNGNGFDASLTTNRNGRKILEKRANAIRSGRFELITVIGKGTTITIEGNLL